MMPGLSLNRCGDDSRHPESLTGVVVATGGTRAALAVGLADASGTNAGAGCGDTGPAQAVQLVRAGCARRRRADATQDVTRATAHVEYITRERLRTRQKAAAGTSNTGTVCTVDVGLTRTALGGPQALTRYALAAAAISSRAARQAEIGRVGAGTHAVCGTLVFAALVGADAGCSGQLDTLS